ncbi:hypothetical protein AAFC00_003666 [Neodothiora populina]|uniref:LsmAD domain-containing protein n=1 Tax=Neodothiora populina TaxID=2781224 RepID=A0ABR3PF06_9PEZI
MSATASPMNGATSAPARQASAAASSTASNAKQQLKTSAGGKALDGPRMQASSPVDSSSTKKAPPKAWQGPNPITQRAAGASAPNGAPSHPARNSPNASRAPTQQQPSVARNNVDRHAHDRTLFLVANFTGLHGRVTFKNGEIFEGIFSGATLESSDSRFSMKMVKRISAPSHSQSNGNAEKTNEYIGTGDDHMMMFNLQDTIDLNVWDVQLSATESKAQNGGPSFRTDAEISGIKNIREKELQPWQPGPDTDVDLSLDASGMGTWDQFAANEKLYNVRSDYDENLYTTTIDRSNPRYKQLEAEAKRIANEIERSEPVNAHVAEERRMNAKADAGGDEEDKYSGVRRDFTPLTKSRDNAYVPPSMRPITSQPTVPGAPFDPAIISSQIARPTVTTSLSSDGQTPKPQTPAQMPAQTDEASKPVTLAQLTTDSANAKPPTATLAAPSITVAGDSQSAKPRRAGEGGTEGVERRVLDSFKQFSNTEKLKYQQHQRAMQERTRTSVRQEKSVKLNDLKKFAANFKLYSRVPDDLVPILAKTKEKQEEIVSKAEQQARDKEVKKTKAPSPVATPTPSKPESEAADKTPRTIPTTGRPDTGNDLAHRQQRAPQNFRASTQGITSPRGPAMTSHRIPPSHPQHRSGAVNPGGPGPMQMPPNLHTAANVGKELRDSGVTSPSSAASSRFNVKAMEFRPNPAASNFNPGQAKTSPEQSKRGSVSAAASSSTHFVSKEVKPPSERTSWDDAFNPIKRMAEKAVADKKDYSNNGGIPQAYRTPPVWEHPEANAEKSYADAFQKSLMPAISPMQTPRNGGMPYQNQLPLPLQNATPQMVPAQHTPRFYAAQPHGMPNQHMDGDRMQYASGNSSVQPSPRMGHPAMAYPGQMHPQMQNYPGAMPGYAMSPAMQMRPVPGVGPHFTPPGPMGGQMMVQQPSSGPYMNGPMGQQMPMYGSPGPAHVQPHFPGHAQPAAMGPYAGGPHTHAMRHQGSQQGHGPGAMYMMPQGGPVMMPQHAGQMPQMRGGYPQQQFQGGPYPMQHRAMSGGGYGNHMTPRQHHAAPQQGPSPGNAPPMPGNGGGDEGK